MLPPVDTLSLVKTTCARWRRIAELMAAKIADLDNEVASEAAESNKTETPHARVLLAGNGIPFHLSVCRS